jgi:hypothetical protein
MPSDRYSKNGIRGSNPRDVPGNKGIVIEAQERPCTRPRMVAPSSSQAFGIIGTQSTTASTPIRAD